MNTRPVALIFACLGTMLFALSAQERSPSPRSLSLDRQWEYKCAEYDGECSPEIVKADTTEVVLNLDKELGANRAQSIGGAICSKALIHTTARPTATF
jgi:hypothetical protein